MARKEGDTSKNQGGRPLTYNAEPDLTTKVDALPDRHELNAIIEPMKRRLEYRGPILRS
jgi:hypothetical protein